NYCYYQISIFFLQRDVWKSPTTDAGKQSKQGRLTLERREDGSFVTIENGQGDMSKDVLVTVFENGRLLVDYSLEEIRDRAELDIVKEHKRKTVSIEAAMKTKNGGSWSASIGGAAHLVNFYGTDAIAVLQLCRKYYAAEMAGFSIPAAEHSTITTWKKSGESAAYLNMLEQFPDGSVSVVSDSYDVFHAVSNIWGDELRQYVVDRANKGCVVIRPDSGDPSHVVVKEIMIDVIVVCFLFGAIIWYQHLLFRTTVTK
ncbi:unnamed protein product, partial [Onchocerca ochengi]